MTYGFNISYTVSIRPRYLPKYLNSVDNIEPVYNIRISELVLCTDLQFISDSLQ